MSLWSGVKANLISSKRCGICNRENSNPSKSNRVFKEAVASFEEKITSDDTAVHDLQESILEVREQLTDLKVTRGSKNETLKSVVETLTRLTNEREDLLKAIESSQDQQKISDDLILAIEGEIKRIIEKKNKILEASAGQEEILNKIMMDIEVHGQKIKKIGLEQAEIGSMLRV